MSKEKIIEQAEKYFQAGKFDRAIKEYQKILDEDPSDMRAKLKIADLCARKKDMALAVKTYHEVADYYSNENFHLKAIAVYKTILKLSPTSIDVNEKLGALYRRVGLDQDALNQFYIVANYYDGKGLSQESLDIRQKILEVDPFNTTGRVRLAELMQANGKAADSIREYERVAQILEQKQDKEGLTEVYEKILYLKPEDLSLLVRLCRLYVEKREFKKVLRRIEMALPAIKQDLNVCEMWAEALLEDRQTDAARRRFKDLYAQSLESKDAERSARIYSRILQEFSDDEDYLKELGEIQKELGETPIQAKPKFRQDFEGTDIINLKKLEEEAKKKGS